MFDITIGSLTPLQIVGGLVVAVAAVLLLGGRAARRKVPAVVVTPEGGPAPSEDQSIGSAKTSVRGWLEVIGKTVVCGVLIGIAAWILWSFLDSDDDAPASRGTCDVIAEEVGFESGTGEWDDYVAYCESLEDQMGD